MDEFENKMLILGYDIGQRDDCTVIDGRLIKRHCFECGKEKKHNKKENKDGKNF